MPLIGSNNQFDKRRQYLVLVQSDSTSHWFLQRTGAHDPPLQKDPIRQMDPQVLPLLFISSSTWSSTWPFLGWSYSLEMRLMLLLIAESHQGPCNFPFICRNVLATDLSWTNILLLLYCIYVRNKIRSSLICMVRQYWRRENFGLGGFFGSSVHSSHVFSGRRPPTCLVWGDRGGPWSLYGAPASL